MIGVVVCCHGDLAGSMCRSVEMIIGPQPCFTAVNIDAGDGLKQVKRKLTKCINDMNESDGVIVFTDIPGGTPCNSTVPLMTDNVEMVTGFNVPCLIKILMTRKQITDVKELSEFAVKYGKRNIYNGQMWIHNKK